MDEERTIDALPVDSATRAHVVAAQADGVTEQIGVGSIVDLVDADHIAGAILAAPAKTPLVDADLLGVVDSEDSNVAKKVTLANLIASIFTTARKIADANFLSNARFWDASAPTKGLGFDLSGITAGQTRSVKWPDKNLDNLDRPLLHVRDQKASGTNGGSSSVGAQVRTLNTLVVNEIPGASLASNQITLPAGKYWVEASAPALWCERQQLWLRYSGGAVALAGDSGYSSAADNVVNRATLSDRLTLASPATLELVHYVSAAKTTDGLGVNAGSGQAETYAQLRVWRID